MRRAIQAQRPARASIMPARARAAMHPGASLGCASWGPAGRGARLEQALGQVDADERGRAAHAGQVVGQHVAAHAEAVDQAGRHAGRRRVAAARHDHDVDLRDRARARAASGPGAGGRLPAGGRRPGRVRARTLPARPAQPPHAGAGSAGPQQHPPKHRCSQPMAARAARFRTLRRRAGAGPGSASSSAQPGVGGAGRDGAPAGAWRTSCGSVFVVLSRLSTASKMTISVSSCASFSIGSGFSRLPCISSQMPAARRDG